MGSRQPTSTSVEINSLPIEVYQGSMDPPLYTSEYSHPPDNNYGGSSSNGGDGSSSNTTNTNNNRRSIDKHGNVIYAAIPVPPDGHEDDTPPPPLPPPISETKGSAGTSSPTTTPNSGSNSNSSSNRNSNNRNNTMKTPTSIITNFNLDSFGSLNESLISPSYVSPVYYTSSIPITSTTHATTNGSLNRNSISNTNNSNSLLSSYYCDDDEQYLVNDNNTITYIVNSNNEKAQALSATPSKTANILNSPSAINNLCYDQAKLNSSNTRSSNNTQVKSLLPIEYYTSNFANGRFLIKSNEISNPSVSSTTNSNSTNNSINDTQLINSTTIFSQKSSSPRLNSISRSATEPIYTTTHEQEKIRGPMMYSTTANSANVLNISPVVTNIITSNSSSNSSNIQNVSNNLSGSNTSTTSSSAISILSSASSIHSNVILKDAEVSCSPESIPNQDQEAKDKKSKKQTSSKKSSNSSLCDKSGIIGFAAEILASVLPTSNNDLKHPKTRYLPELYPFIKKIARKCKIDIRTFLYALVYSQRFGEALLSHHKEAVGEYGTNHRIFLASILLAYQYQIDHGMKVNFKLDAKKLSKYTDGVWTEKEVEMMCKAFLSTKNFILDIDDDVVKEFVETHKADLCWYS